MNPRLRFRLLRASFILTVMAIGVYFPLWTDPLVESSGYPMAALLLKMAALIVIMFGVYRFGLLVRKAKEQVSQ